MFLKKSKLNFNSLKTLDYLYPLPLTFFSLPGPFQSYRTLLRTEEKRGKKRKSKPPLPPPNPQKKKERKKDPPRFHVLPFFFLCVCWGKKRGRKKTTKKGATGLQIAMRCNARTEAWGVGVSTPERGGRKIVMLDCRQMESSSTSPIIDSPLFHWIWPCRMMKVSRGQRRQRRRRWW